MGKKTSCVGIEVGGSVVVAIGVDLDKADLVELDQIKLVLLVVERIEVDAFEEGLVEENPVIVDRTKEDLFGVDLVDVNLVVVDLPKLGLGIPVENEETLAEQEGFGGLLEELATPGGGVVVFLLTAAQDSGG